MCFFCLESACKDHETYKHAVKRLASLVKEGGYLLIVSSRHEQGDEGYYFFNGVKFNNLVLKRGFIVETLESNGFTIVNEDYLSQPEVTCGDSEGYLFFSARKHSKD